VIETHEQAGEFKEPQRSLFAISSKTKSRHAMKRDG
jgi:hypothetical protein